MQLFWCLCTLLVALSARYAASSQCAALGATSFTLTVASRRNDTGHWTISVDALKEKPNQASLSSSAGQVVAVGVRHSTVTCQESHTVQLTATADLDSLAAAPRSDYELFPGLGYYKLHTYAMPWEEATRRCADEGTHLIVINSDEEAGIIRTYFSRKPNIQNADYKHSFFIGFDDKEVEGQYVTVLGAPLANSGYTRWGPGQPKGGTQYQCGEADEAGLLHDAACHLRRAYVCEYGG